MTPVDAKTVLPGDIKFDRSRHVSHFATCPNAADFRGKKLGDGLRFSRNAGGAPKL